MNLEMKIHNVFYPKNGDMNLSRNLMVQYKFAYAVNANDLDHAFKLGQHDFNPSLEFVGCRSMCIGDIIMDEKGKYYMVQPLSFSKVDPELITFSED